LMSLSLSVRRNHCFTDLGNAGRLRKSPRLSAKAISDPPLSMGHRCGCRGKLVLLHNLKASSFVKIQHAKCQIEAFVAISMIEKNICSDGKAF